MFEITTKRLRLLPLDEAHLKLLQKGRVHLEESLGLTHSAWMSEDTIVQEVQSSCAEWIEEVARDRENYVWHTNWEIIVKEKNISIGGFCFYGTPDDRGEVQIGYYIHPHFQRKGYMTEALREVVRWALEQPHVESIKAETPKNNIPSQLVLEKIGMRQRGETGETIWWRRVKHEEE